MKVYLYVKTHNVTGLKYFGKTTKPNPHSYGGSGVFWKKHLRGHGNDVTTEVVAEFDLDTQIDELTEFALAFSVDHDIVGSDEWANLIYEDGLAGKPVGSPGHVFTDEERERLSSSQRRRWTRPGTKESMSAAQAASWSPERKKAHAEWLKTDRWTEENKALHSEKMKEKWADPEWSGFDIGSVVKTEQHKRRISEALTGKPRTKEHAENLRQALRNVRPARAPAEATWISNGVYDVYGHVVRRVKSHVWQFTYDGEVVTVPTIRAAMAFLKEKD